MGTYYNAKVPSDGLILSLDAANAKCFINGATSATNLVSGGAITGANGNPGTGAHTPNTSNFPAYNSVNGGVFDFVGGKGMNCDEDLGSHTEFTLSIWFYKPTSTLQYITDGRNDGGQWFIFNYTTDINLEYTAVLSYNYEDPFNASNADFLNTWQQMVVVSDVSESRIYLNSTEVSTYVAQGSVDEALGVNFRIGTRFTTSNQFTGYYGPICAYNRVLTEVEIVDSFNAHRRRFDL